jgi:hypothetical protein
VRQASRFGFRAKGFERERAGVHAVGTHSWRRWRKDAERYERQQEREAHGRAIQIYNQLGDWRDRMKSRKAFWNAKRVD